MSLPVRDLENILPMDFCWTECIWKVRSLYRAGSLMAAGSELARYKLDLVGVQVVRWDKGSTVRAGDYNFFNGKGN
jgi:hypothetical protein